MLDPVGLRRLYGTWTHVGALALIGPLISSSITGPMRIASSHQHSDHSVQWPPRSALSSWGLSPAQKDSIMYDAHTVVLPLAPIWIDTWRAYPQMGQGWGEGVRCRGKAAHAEVTSWNNGADERPSCLGFREEDYWMSRSPFCIRLESAVIWRGGGKQRIK